MIIHGNDIMEVGKRYLLKIWDGDLNLHHCVPALCLAVVTKQDYLDFCKEEGVLELISGQNGPYYYKISID